MAVDPACLWRALDTDLAAIPTLRVRLPPGADAQRVRSAAQGIPQCRHKHPPTRGAVDVRRHSGYNHRENRGARY